MTPFPGLRRVFRIAGVRRDVKANLNEELDFHFQCTVEDLVARGMTPSAAREEAHRRFGDLRRYRRELESMGRKRLTMDRGRPGSPWLSRSRSPWGSAPMPPCSGWSIGCC